jgi:hypothetical protein
MENEIKTEALRRCISYAIAHRMSTEFPIAAQAELDDICKRLREAEGKVDMYRGDK